MSETQPPDLGQDPWGEDLNAHLAWLSSRLDVVEARAEHVFNSYAYKFSAATPPAIATEVRLNNVNATQATLIDIRKIDMDGADRTPVLQMLSVGGKIRINDWDNAAISHTYDVANVPSMDATNVQIPVAWRSGSGTLPTSGQARVNVALLVALNL